MSDDTHVSDVDRVVHEGTDLEGLDWFAGFRLKEWHTSSTVKLQERNCQHMYSNGMYSD